MNNTKKIILAYMAIEGLTQQDMAILLNRSRQTFNYKLNGKIAFTDKEKMIIAELFGASVESIFFSPKVANFATKVALQ